MVTDHRSQVTGHWSLVSRSESRIVSVGVHEYARLGGSGPGQGRGLGGGGVEDEDLLVVVARDEERAAKQSVATTKVNNSINNIQQQQPKATSEVTINTKSKHNSSTKR